MGAALGRLNLRRGAMSEWWSGLSGVNQAFYCGAAFFSVFFVWQIMAVLIGLGGGEGDFDGVGHDADVGIDDLDGDAAAGAAYDDMAGGAADSAATMVAFKLLSIRAIVTFCTLFSWGTALYLNNGEGVSKAMGISSVWGLAGMASVALVMYLLPKLAHTGTKSIQTCLGVHGTVYLDIAADGPGEVRVPVSGVISYVKARSADGKALKSGTPIVVKQVLDETTVEVAAVTAASKEGDE